MVHSIPDLTMTGAALPVTSTTTACVWAVLSAPTANTADLRVGGSTVGAANGAIIPKGTSLALQPVADTRYLDLGSTYVYGASNDKCAVLYVTH